MTAKRQEFRKADVVKLLADCHRRCCICHRYCGTKIEVDHIEQAATGGTGDISNAIAVCFECHAEIHSYNDQHPRGRKFRPEELKHHRDKWLEICRDNPAALIGSPREIVVGPLQAMVDELQYNLHASKVVIIGATSFGDKFACPYADTQFFKAIDQGAIAVLEDDLRMSLIDTYVHLGRLKELFSAHLHQSQRDTAHADFLSNARGPQKEAPDKIEATLKLLLQFLGSENQPEA